MSNLDGFLSDLQVSVLQATKYSLMSWVYHWTFNTLATWCKFCSTSCTLAVQCEGMSQLWPRSKQQKRWWRIQALLCHPLLSHSVSVLHAQQKMTIRYFQSYSSRLLLFLTLLRAPRIKWVACMCVFHLYVTLEKSFHSKEVNSFFLLIHLQHLAGIPDISFFCF